MTAAVRQFLAENAATYDPRKYLGLAKEAIKDTVKGKMREFGCSEKAELFSIKTGSFYF